MAPKARQPRKATDSASTDISAMEEIIESLKHRLETEKRLTGVGAAAIDHYVLLNQAVTQVFGDIESDQMRLAIEEGHAYLGRPDPKRNQPRDDKNKKDKKKGNTPFKKPTKWSEGMRPCLNCKDFAFDFVGAG